MGFPIVGAIIDRLLPVLDGFAAPLPPSLREVPRRGGGSVVIMIGHSPSHSLRCASPLFEGAKCGFSNVGTGLPYGPHRRGDSRIARFPSSTSLRREQAPALQRITQCRDRRPRRSYIVGAIIDRPFPILDGFAGGTAAPLPPSLREVPRRGGGSVVLTIGHSPSHSLRCASPLCEGAKCGLPNVGTGVPDGPYRRGDH